MAKPNILYIMADQIAAPLLSLHDRHSPIKMPHLDSLAAGGVVFDSAYCNSPLCAPSRFTMVTGQLPSKIGGYDNASDLPADTPTYAHYLRREGYHTALAGKMHFVGPDQLHGYEQRLTSDIYPGDYGWSVNWDEPDIRPDWYHDMSSVLNAGPVVRTNQLDYDEEVIYRATQYLFDQARLRTDQPFCLTVSMTHPHDPYAMTKDFWDLYEDVDIPLPQVSRIPDEQQDPHSARVLKCIDLYGKEMPEERIRAARRAYFAACSYVDDKIGRLLKTLNDVGLADDTIVVFTGDHGDMLGERGLWYKMNWFENSARVPMLFYAPSRFAPARVSENVSTMDLLPTFVALAGGEIHPQLPLDGVSLLPHLTGQPTAADGSARHDTVVGEYMGEGTQAPVVMIRRGPWKFVYSPLDPPVLFNLREDPLELNNLAAGVITAEGAAGITKTDAKETTKGATVTNTTTTTAVPTPPRTPSPPNNHLPAKPATQIPETATAAGVTNASEIASILNSFLAETYSRWDFAAVTRDVLASQRRRRLVYSALVRGEITFWDHTHVVPGRSTYVRNHSKGPLGDVESLARWPRVGSNLANVRA